MGCQCTVFKLKIKKKEKRKKGEQEKRKNILNKDQLQSKKITNNKKYKLQNQQIDKKKHSITILTSFFIQ